MSFFRCVTNSKFETDRSHFQSFLLRFKKSYDPRFELIWRWITLSTLEDFYTRITSIMYLLSYYRTDQGDVAALKKTCSREVIERCQAERRALESQGIFLDNQVRTILPLTRTQLLIFESVNQVGWIVSLYYIDAEHHACLYRFYTFPI